jgi:hypothetical protein
VFSGLLSSLFVAIRNLSIKRLPKGGEPVTTSRQTRHKWPLQGTERTPVRASRQSIPTTYETVNGMVLLLLSPFLLYSLLGTLQISNHVTVALCFHRRHLRSSYGRQLDFKLMSSDNESDVNKLMSKMEVKIRTRTKKKKKILLMHSQHSERKNIGTKCTVEEETFPQINTHGTMDGRRYNHFGFRLLNF